eukprot:jgi/Botrbrau1/5816/Bobra.0366s0002.1
MIQINRSRKPTVGRGANVAETPQTTPNLHVSAKHECAMGTVKICGIGLR